MTWDADACRRVHQATLDVLADPGIDMHHERARGLLAQAGAQIDGLRVRMEAELVEQALASAPSSFIVKSRGGHEPLLLEDGRTYFGTGGDCLYTRDPVTGERRRTRIRDIEDLAAVSEKLPNIDFVMSMGLLEDARSDAELAVFAALLRGTRKPIVLDPVCEPKTLAKLQAMAALCGQPDSFIIYAMPNPPLTHSEGALGRLMGCAELGIPLVYAAGCAPGLTAPCSRSAMVVSANAEVLSGLVVHQLTSPGAPFVFGGQHSAVSMRTSSILYCSPEIFAQQQASIELSRFYGLPSWTFGGCSDSKALDGQWAAEAAITLSLEALTGCTMVHDVGYLESGLQSSQESVVFADEMIGYVRAYLEGVRLDDLDSVVEEIRAVGPGGEHLQRNFTRHHHRRLWQPTVLDHWMHDHWIADGGRTMLERLTARARELQSEPPAFTLEQDVVEQLDVIVSVST